MIENTLGHNIAANWVAIENYAQSFIYIKGIAANADVVLGVHGSDELGAIILFHKFKSRDA